MGQLRTWFSILAYSLIPATGATIIAFIIFWIAHTLALKQAHVRLSRTSRCTPNSPPSAFSASP